MGRNSCILLGFLLVFSLGCSVKCASLQRHFRSQRDVELPAIQKPQELSLNNTTSNITNLNTTTSLKPQEIPTERNEIKLDQDGHQNKTKIEDIKGNEGPTEKSVVQQDNEIKNETKTIEDKIKEDVIKEDNSSLKTEVQEAINLTKQVHKDNNTKLIKESGRALDIEKYVSPDFHNKNNVYILPTSPEIQKYLDPDTPDFSDHMSELDHYVSHDYNNISTTPLGDFLGSKYRSVADSIKQNLDELDNLKDKRDEEIEDKHDDEDKYDIDKLIDNANNKDNDTDVSLHVKETKILQHKTEEENKNKNINTDLETGKSVDYKSSYVKTKSYDEKPENGSPNNISDTEKSNDSTSESTTKKQKEEAILLSSTTQKSFSTKKPLYTTDISKLDTIKPKSLKHFTTESPIDPVHEINYSPATDNSINIAKRGSTKFLEALNKPTTPTPSKGIDIDDKGFSIPPSATAWSLASLKDTPEMNNTTPKLDIVQNNTVKFEARVDRPLEDKDINRIKNETVVVPKTTVNVTKFDNSTETNHDTKDAAVEENNVIKVTVPPFSTSTTSQTKSVSPSETITTNFTPNTDVITTDSPPKTTPTLFYHKENKTVSTTASSKVEIPIKETKTQKNENEIFKTSEEVPDIKSTNDDTAVTLNTMPTILNVSEKIETRDLTTKEDTNIMSSTVSSQPETTNTEVTTILSTTSSVLTTTETKIPDSTSLVNITTKMPMENVTQHSNTTESVTESPLYRKEDNTKNIIEENIETTMKTKEKALENEIITTQIENTTLSTITSAEENQTEAVINIEKKISSSALIDSEETGIRENNFNSKESDKSHGPKNSEEFPATNNILEETISSTEKSLIKVVPKEKSSKKEDISTTPIEELSTNPPKEEATLKDELPFKEILVKNIPQNEPEVITTIPVTTMPPATTKLPPTTMTIPDTTVKNSSFTTTDPTTGTEMLQNGEENDESNPGMVAAIAISAVAAVCLVLLAGLLIVMRKRQKRVTYGQRCRPVSLDAYSLDNVSVYNSVRRKGGIRASKRSYGNPAFDDPVSISHQMNFQSLAKFNENLDEICAEFEEIPQVTARANEVPPGCETKNRYANIIPLPETRVFLRASDNDPHSDYINANYVTGPKNTRGYYIACQAPMDNTIDDFWRMIWEQNCRVILMLTNLYENGVEKCADYLPPSEVLDCHRLFGDYQITLKKRDVKEKYIISSLQLKNMVSNSWREVTHLWYLGWPERGVPGEANSLIAFLIEARSHLKAASNNNKDDKDNETSNIHISGVSGSEGGPVVVHCSPGTGRTGTVISCDIAIRDFELTRMVDIPKIVYRVRRDRASAVQTKDQYCYIYKVITLYATKLTGGVLDSI